MVCSNYDFASLAGPGTIGQCKSSLPPGTFSYMTRGSVEAWVPITTSVSAFGASVWAAHINGFVFSTSITSTLVGRTTALLATAQPTSSLISSSLITGARVGIGVGVSLSVLGFCSLLLAFFLIRRHVSSNPSDRPCEESLVGQDTLHEVELRQQDSVHEMSATLKVPFETTERRPLSRQG